MIGILHSISCVSSIYVCMRTLIKCESLIRFSRAWSLQSFCFCYVPSVNDRVMKWHYFYFYPLSTLSLRSWHYFTAYLRLAENIHWWWMTSDGIYVLCRKKNVSLSLRFLNGEKKQLTDSCNLVQCDVFTEAVIWWNCMVKSYMHRVELKSNTIYHTKCN